MNLFLLIFGLLILIKSSDVMVEAAAKIAAAAKVPPFIVGLIIVAIGTSAPETMVGVISGIQKMNLLTLGDVVGSNIANIALVLGLTAMVFPLQVESQVPKRELPLLILIQILLIVYLLTGNILQRIEAITLLLGTMLFLGYIAVKTKRTMVEAKPANEYEDDVFEFIKDQDVNVCEETGEECLQEVPGPADAQPVVKEAPRLDNPALNKQIIRLLAGLAGLFAGAEITVRNAVGLAAAYGMSEEMIGVTIVALGTSLPELVSCLMAAYKKETDIAVGNIIGSNIFNILFVLGLSGTIHPIAVEGEIILDLFLMLGLSAFLMVPAVLYGKITKYYGIALMLTYMAFLFTKFS